MVYAAIAQWISLGKGSIQWTSPICRRSWQSPVPKVTRGWPPRDKRVDLECQYDLRAPEMSILQEWERRGTTIEQTSRYSFGYRPTQRRSDTHNRVSRRRANHCRASISGFISLQWLNSSATSLRYLGSELVLLYQRDQSLMRPSVNIYGSGLDHKSHHTSQNFKFLPGRPP